MPFSKAHNIQVLPVASKPFSEMLTMTNFWFKDFWTLCLAFTFIQAVSTSWLKKVQKSENCLFQRFSSTYAFDLKVVSKPFSKMLSMSNLGFTQSCMLSLASPKNIFTTCSLKNVQKKLKSHFQTLRTFVFDFKVASKPISKVLPLAKFKMKPFWRLWFAFPENGFNFVPQKVTKKGEKYHISTLKTIVFHSKPFSKMLPMTKFDFLFQKMVSWHNFAFDLKVASDLLSKIVPIPSLSFN